MLKIIPDCEHCNKDLLFDSEVAMICSFKYTFYSDCVSHVLHQVCSNCEDGFTKRPIRSAHLLDKYPVSTEHFFKSVDQNKHIKKLGNTP